MTPPATGSVRVWADGRSLCWEGDVKMYYLAIILPIPGSTLYQFNTEILRFNGETVTPEFGSYDSTSVYLFAITSLYKNYALNNASILPTSLSFQIGVSPKILRKVKLDDPDRELFLEKDLIRDDIPDSNLCTFSFNPREWVEQLIEQRVREEEQQQNAAHRNGSNPIKRICGRIFSSISRACSNGTMISATEIAQIEKQLNGRTHVSAPTTNNETNRQKPTDTPTTKELIMNGENTPASMPPGTEPLPTPTPPPAPEKSPEDKIVDDQEKRLAVIKNDLDPSQPNGKKIENRDYSWLSATLGTTKSILDILKDPKLANTARVPQIIAETDTIQKEINRTRISKWGKWSELEELLKGLNTRIRNIGCEEGQLGSALKKELDRIAESVHKKHWGTLETSALHRALSDADALHVTLVKAEDEAIARTAQLEKEIVKQLQEIGKQAEESEKQAQAIAEREAKIKELSNQLEEARKKAEQQPNAPAAPPATTTAAAPAKLPETDAKEKTSPVGQQKDKHILLVIVLGAALFLLLVCMLLVFLIMKLYTDKDQQASNTAPTYQMPSHLPAYADPRVRGLYRALVDSGMIPEMGAGSWSSNSTMNGTNNIGGDNLVNGSFMIKIIMPPTNLPVVQPIIVTSNATVTVTNPPAAGSSTPEHYQPDRKIKKKCSYEVEPPVPGAQRNSDGSWGWEIIQHPGEDAYEYRVDPDKYEVTYSYTSTADPSSTVLEAIDSKGSYVPIAIGTVNHRLPAGTLGHRCGVRADTGGVFKIRFTARERTWNAPGYTPLASVSR